MNSEITLCVSSGEFEYVDENAALYHVEDDFQIGHQYRKYVSVELLDYDKIYCVLNSTACTIGNNNLISVQHSRNYFDFEMRVSALMCTFELLILKPTKASMFPTHLILSSSEVTTLNGIYVIFDPEIDLFVWRSESGFKTSIRNNKKLPIDLKSFLCYKYLF